MSNNKTQRDNNAPLLKQSSVEWLLDQITYDNGYGQRRCSFIDTEDLTSYFEQAKRMHKEETTITENTSDGYHTFKILYDIRKAYNVALFNEWGSTKETISIQLPNGRSKWSSQSKYNVHKSRKHHDGEYPFGKQDWFIVCANLPSGQISNHYPMEDWDLFKIPETEKALFEFDGHTTEDVIKRLLKL